MLEIVLDRQGKLFSEPNLETTPTLISPDLDQCEQELSLLNDLLDLQMMQTLTLNTDDYLQDWLLHVWRLTKKRAQTTNKAYRLISLLNCFLLTDLSSLTRILRELLHNAFKYTPPGEQITITAPSHEPCSFEGEYR